MKLLVCKCGHFQLQHFKDGSCNWTRMPHPKKLGEMLCKCKKFVEWK